jgi:HSP20 family molecular chaperone IbpA
MFCRRYRTEDPDAATGMAKYRNGVLRVELPKAWASRQPSIPITVR